MKKTTNALIAVLLLVVMIPNFGRCQTNNITFEVVKDKNNFICMSDTDIKEIFINGEIEWCKIESTEEQKYIKKCLITSENKTFSEIVLTSETFVEETTKKRLECVHIEVIYYDSRTLYVKKANEKLWWQATNLLNLE